MKKIFFGFVVSLSLALPLVAMEAPIDEEEAHLQEVMDRMEHIFKQVIVKLGNLNQEEVDAMEFHEIANELRNSMLQPNQDSINHANLILDEELNVAADAFEDEPDIDIPTATEFDNMWAERLEMMVLTYPINLGDPQVQLRLQLFKCFEKQVIISELDA